MEEFFKPWMKHCNPQLILRFWRHKGSVGKLTLPTIYDFKIVYINTIFGELHIKQSNMFDPHINMKFIG